LCKLRHANIITLYGICTDRAKNVQNDSENFFCLVMEYGSNHNLIHGESRSGHKELKSYDSAFILKILKQIIRALVYLHTSEPPIIHRDLKPTNIILDADLILDYQQLKKKK